MIKIKSAPSMVRIFVVYYFVNNNMISLLREMNFVIASVESG